MVHRFEQFSHEVRVRLKAEGYLFLHSGVELSYGDGLPNNGIESTHFSLVPLRVDEDGKSIPIDSVDAMALAEPMLNVYYWIELPH